MAFASPDTTRLQITRRLDNWAHDFNAKNELAVCDLFASDLIASYQGTKDRNYEQMCEGLSLSIHHPDKTFRYETPKIEQIIPKGDIAVVRLIWTLKIYDKNHNISEIIREKGLDVFRKEPNGKWKIIISYAYPLNLENVSETSMVSS